MQKTYVIKDDRGKFLSGNWYGSWTGDAEDAMEFNSVEEAEKVLSTPEQDEDGEYTQEYEWFDEETAYTIECIYTREENMR